MRVWAESEWAAYWGFVVGERQKRKDKYRDLSTAQGTMRLFPASVEMTCFIPSR
jgi:hypothetical protein